MNELTIAQKVPYTVDLEPGKYWWCSCGQSATQSFCDGSHKGSKFNPVAFEVIDKMRLFLCGCKKTSKKPYCDGTHNKL